VTTVEPVWLVEARKDLGLRELVGAPTSPKIAGWLASLGAWWRDDETPWCGTAVAAWMKASGIELPKHWYRAKGWLEWGMPVAPVVGAVVVFERPGGGHVGLLVGKDAAGRLLVLGGNQGNAVTIAPFDAARAISYRWPSSRFDSYRPAPLPRLVATGASSTNEA
jgi:uncharacterized protein (TIGR02594 family)